MISCLVALLIGGISAKPVLGANSYIISGTVSDASGPLAHILIQTIPAGGGGVTNAAGAYAFTVPAGNYALRFSDPSNAHAPGFYSSSGFTFSADNRTLVLASSADTAVENLVMPKGYTIRGRVNDTAGPLAGISVYAGALGLSDWAASLELGDISDSAGHYLIVVPAGTWLLDFADPSGVHQSSFYSLTGPTDNQTEATTITIASNNLSQVDFSLPLAPAIGPLRIAAAIYAATEVGTHASGSFTNAAKTVRIGQYITLQVRLSPALAGTSVSLWLARKNASGVWSPFRILAHRTVGADGLVRYSYRRSTGGLFALRAYFAGNARYQVAWSPARQIRWR